MVRATWCIRVQLNGDSGYVNPGEVEAERCCDAPSKNLRVGEPRRLTTKNHVAVPLRERKQLAGGLRLCRFHVICGE
jgi:hypothetical protein